MPLVVGFQLGVVGFFLLVQGVIAGLLGIRLGLHGVGAGLDRLAAPPFVRDQGGRHDQQDGGDQQADQPPLELQPLLPGVALALGRQQLAPQRGVARILLGQQRQAEIEILAAQRALGVRQPGMGQTRFGVPIGIPQLQRFLKAEQGVAVVLIVIRLLRGLQFLFRTRPHREAFRVRLVLADGRLEGLHALEAVGRVRRQRSIGGLQQLARSVGRLQHVFGGRQQAVHDALAGVRRLAGEDFEQDAAQQVHVAARTDLLDGPRGHFGRHVGRRAAHAAGRCRPAGVDGQRTGQGDAPVHDQDFAKVAQHHVLRLQVAMHHVARVGKGHGVADLVQDLQVLRQRLAADDARPGSAADAFHRVEQGARLIPAQVVDGHDVGMVQVARDDRLGQKRVALALALAAGAEHLDGHDAVDRSLAGGIDHAHAALADHLQQFVVGRRGRRLAEVAEGAILDHQIGGGRRFGVGEIFDGLTDRPLGARLDRAFPNLEQLAGFVLRQRAGLRRNPIFGGGRRGFSRRGTGRRNRRPAVRIQRLLGRSRRPRRDGRLGFAFGLSSVDNGLRNFLDRRPGARCSGRSWGRAGGAFGGRGAGGSVGRVYSPGSTSDGRGCRRLNRGRRTAAPPGQGDRGPPRPGRRPAAPPNSGPSSCP